MTILTLTLNPAVDKSTSVPTVAPERKLRCGPLRVDPGGGGINVSRAIRRLGGESVAVYARGGRTGAALEELLDREGLAQVPIPIAEETRENFTVLEETSGQQYRFGMPAHPDPRGAERCLAAVEGWEPAQSSLRQGSLSQCTRGSYVRLAESSRRRGIKVVGHVR